MKKPLTRDHSSEKHLQIIKDIWNRKYDVEWIERYVAIFLCILKLFFPTRWIRHFTKNMWYKVRNRALEIYMLIKIITLIVILWWQYINTFTVFLAIYFLIDLAQYFLGLIFLANVYTKLPSIRKNFAHLMLNFLEFIMAFAVLYMATSSVQFDGHTIVNSFLVFYYSFVTATFVGDGDMHIIGILWRKLVFLETIMAFLFIMIIVSSFVASIDLKDDD